MEKPQQTAKNTRHHATREEIEHTKTHLGHIFDVDGKGNLTFKAVDNIPAFKMIFVRGGSFDLGEEESYDNPPHPVKLTYNFFIGKFQVTQELYREITGKNPSDFQGTNHPVEQVNWKEAMDCCNLLNKKIGFNPVCDKDYELLDQSGKKTTDILKVSGFRLPTEAEWEYAARGGSSSSPLGGRPGGGNKMPGGGYSGSNHLDEVGWYSENNQYETKPVGLKFPNQLGIYDMSGNVWEWCLDWYDEKFFRKNSKHVNPLNSKEGSSRVLRGGSWINRAASCRSANRISSDPDRRWGSGGFRLLFAFQFT